MVRAPEPGRAVPLTSELERRVEDQDRVRTGIYGSASEVSREALRLFFRYDQARMSEVDNLDHRIGVGSAELDRGLGIPGDEARRRSRSRSLDQLPPPDQVSLGYVLAPAALADIDEIAHFLATTDAELVRSPGHAWWWYTCLRFEHVGGHTLSVSNGSHQAAMRKLSYSLQQLARSAA